jgi:tricorn protease-like protein
MKKSMLLKYIVWILSLILMLFTGFYISKSFYALYRGINKVNKTMETYFGYVKWASDGKRLAISGSNFRMDELYIIDINTHEIRLLMQKEREISFNNSLIPLDWSLQNGDLAYLEYKSNYDYGIWLLSPDEKKEPRYFTQGKSITWSPDENYVAIFDQTREDNSTSWNSEIHLFNFNTNSDQIIFSNKSSFPGGMEYISWSPDNQWLVFAQGSYRNSGSDSDLYLFNLLTSKAIKFTTEYNSISPSWSPNSKYLAYISDSREKRRVLIISTIDGNCRVQLPKYEQIFSIDWSPDGRYIAFTSNGELFLLDVVKRFGEDFLSTGPKCP